MAELKDIWNIVNPLKFVGEQIVLDGIHPDLQDTIENINTNQSYAETAITSIAGRAIGEAGSVGIGPVSLGAGSIVSAGSAIGSLQKKHAIFIEKMTENNVPGFSVIDITDPKSGDVITAYIDASQTINDDNNPTIVWSNGSTFNTGPYRSSIDAREAKHDERFIRSEIEKASSKPAGQVTELKMRGISEEDYIKVAKLSANTNSPREESTKSLKLIKEFIESPDLQATQDQAKTYTNLIGYNLEDAKLIAEVTGVDETAEIIEIQREMVEIQHSLGQSTSPMVNTSPAIGVNNNFQ